LVGGDLHRSIQPVDVRDLVAFMLDRIGQRQTGTYNVVAPADHATYGGLIDACIRATGATAEPVWVEAEWLTARGVAEWTELPLWRTPVGTWAVDGSRAQRAGLVCRPLADTVFDAWAWLQRERPVAHPRASEHGLDPGREAGLLADWDEELVRRSG